MWTRNPITVSSSVKSWGPAATEIAGAREGDRGRLPEERTGRENGDKPPDPEGHPENVSRIRDDADPGQCELDEYGLHDEIPCRGMSPRNADPDRGESEDGSDEQMPA